MTQLLPSPPAGRRAGRAAALVLPVALAAAAAAALLAAGDGGEAPPPPPSPATATAERRDLFHEETFNGRLGYSDARAVTARRPGTLTWLPAEGTALRRGRPLYEVDGRPTAHLMDGSRPAWRTLRQGMRGADVRQLESNLVALGHDPVGAIAVDDRFDGATAAAVRRWQDARGVSETGRVELGDVVFLPGGRRVSKRRAAVGDVLRPGMPVLATTATRRIATADVEASRQSLLRRGDRVQVELPDGGLVSGRVARIAPSADPAKGEGGEATVAVTVALRGGGRTLDQAPVTISVRRLVKRNALAVPVTALLARRGGGYAVEVVGGARRRVVPVRLGLFAGGHVEVAARGLRPGARVVVPR